MHEQWMSQLRVMKMTQLRHALLLQAGDDLYFTLWCVVPSERMLLVAPREGLGALRRSSH